jgi:hypothetical protein
MRIVFLATLVVWGCATTEPVDCGEHCAATDYAPESRLDELSEPQLAHLCTWYTDEVNGLADESPRSTECGGAHACDAEDGDCWWTEPLTVASCMFSLDGEACTVAEIVRCVDAWVASGDVCGRDALGECDAHNQCR